MFIELYIGLEGVGMRQCVAVAADKTGRILSSARLVGEPISLHTTKRDVLRTRIFKLIKSVILPLGLTVNDLKGTTICIGLTGVTFPYDANVDLPHEFAALGINIKRLICTGDAEIIFASHTTSNQGSLIISSMGSTAYIPCPEHEGIRFGGWGPIFGDEGSGFAMGCSVIREISEEVDKKHSNNFPLWVEVDKWLLNPGHEITEWKEASILWRKRTQEFKSGEYNIPTALFSFFNEISNTSFWFLRSVVSGLVIPLMRAWRQNCIIADSIIQTAASSLVKQHCAACDVANFNPRGKPLIFYGGVIVHNPGFRNLLLGKINSEFNWTFDPITPKMPHTMRPVVGALLFSLGQSSTGKLRLPNKEIIDRLFFEQGRLHTEGNLQNE